MCDSGGLLLRAQVAMLFDRWAALVEESPGEKVHAPFVSHLQQAGFLKVTEFAKGGLDKMHDRMQVQASIACVSSLACLVTAL